ncbi:PDR/VanB family oxidoreductase [Hoyosella subflava]|uniref:Iron-sulfur oxidoreductase subunit beta n=1 Tax=Hoyosella subflava (strain DSM 45089 / JCM 17490 / NBRC 109087 / DQS3-9A1) TaxID=443218 RepID=F6ER21_HOYSD|nr:PDR/VanB family oxidoreductase [Hoyosella subflava]AEF40708.1 Iron-sulfur oxidoreductase subunit beta [Hoyosella subflava DQS3-9A1]
MTPGSAVPTVTSGPSLHEFTTELTVAIRRQVADAVVALELVHSEGDDLPAWEPGAHVDLLLAEGLVRQYSLCGDPRSSDRWHIGVLRDPNSRGGSQHVHEQLCEGATVTVRGPRNHFELVDSPRYQFIAGGIGITPMMPMIAAADRAGADWSLLYLGRSRTTMAFSDDLLQMYGDKVTVWADDERGAMFDLQGSLQTPRTETEVYCCGPGPLMDAVEKLCSHWPEGSLHLERFAARKQTGEEAAAGLDSYQVVCQRSGITVAVEPGISMLEALEDADVPILSSCLDGVCGTCQTRVLEGTPDHRDSLLNAAERASGSVILPCVSRSRTEKLVLDL